MAEHILYVRPMCMFCWRVTRAAQALGVELETRNIWADEVAGQELFTATGRATVPVLRIIDKAGQSQWIPESSDIVTYLQKTFGS